MELLTEKLTSDGIKVIRNKYGSYVKVTVDVENGWIVVGPELHADAVPMLKEKGSVEKNVWGGWINFINKEIEFSAVWNIRSEPSNSSMEILDSEVRVKFEKIVKDYFEFLWM